MRYFFEKPDFCGHLYGRIYTCNHPIYNRCTLFEVGKFGIAIIQQRFEPESKRTYWAEIDDWITDAIYLSPKFKKYFDTKAGTPTNDLYPTVTVRQIMWALRLKPLKKERWETVFDHNPI